MQVSKTATLVTITGITAALLFWALTADHNSQVATDTRDSQDTVVKLYWFIPDGLRTDPTLFNIYDWADQGLLPNIKRMMDEGAYGYSIPVFPGHTPTNFATLLTGSTPRVHGITDGPMHIEGYPLKMVSKGGFSSISKKVPPIWHTLEQQGEGVSLLSVPGSTPPELAHGITIRGRWGGWGVDFPAVNFNSAEDRGLRVLQGHRDKVFQFGPELTKFTNSRTPASWQLVLPPSFSEPREVKLSHWMQDIFAYLYDSTDDGRENYNSVLFSKDKKNELARLEEGEWSDWLPVTLAYQVNNDYNIYTPKKMDWERNLGTISLDTQVKIRVIRLGAKDNFRIRFFYNNLNKYSVKPSYLASDIISRVGPMMDFADNFPPQLIYYPEDKQAFFEEAGMTMDWHKKAVGYLMNNTPSDVIIHDIYTPNQMLTSRWWLGYIDPKSPRYNQVSTAERKQLWDEVKIMYQGIDAIVGEILDNADPNTYVVVSSDHGAVPLHKEVRLNNLFAKKGLLKFSIDKDTGAYWIDWEKTKVVYLKMDGVYINPEGLGGNYKRASGTAYEKLREDVVTMLTNLEDDNGSKPLGKVTKWENAEFLDLPTDRVGDLIIANVPGYGWVEDLTEDFEVFKESITSGYKQAVIPDQEKGMWTPFLIKGPGVKKGYELPAPIKHINQYPTIMRLLKKQVPPFVEGEPIDSLFELN